MFCKECGSQLADDARFCPNCGKEVTGIVSVESTGSDPPKKKPVMIIAVGAILVCITAIGIFFTVGERTDKSTDNEIVVQNTNAIQELTETESFADNSKNIIVSESEIVVENDYGLYAASLINLINENALPDGRIMSYMSDAENYPIQFSIYDINSDGEEELIIKLPNPTCNISGQYIYRLNEEKTGLEDLCSLDVDTVYYDTGFFKVPAWYIQCLSKDFCPYDIKMWDAGEYLDAGRVEAWEKEYMPSDFSGNPFPDNIDSDGNGIVYFISEELGIDYNNPVDDSEYWSYEEEFFGNGIELIIPWADLTVENIEKTTNYTEQRINTENIVPIYTGDVYDSELQFEEESLETTSQIPYVPITVNIIGMDFEEYLNTTSRITERQDLSSYFAQFPLIKNTEGIIYYQDMTDWYSIIGVKDGYIVTYTDYIRDGTYNVDYVFSECGVSGTDPYVIYRDGETDFLIWRLDNAYIIMGGYIFNSGKIRLFTITVTQYLNSSWIENNVAM